MAQAGKRSLITRSIDFDPFEPTFEEKLFGAAKRACAAFAGIALSISALDLLNIRSVESAAAFIHENREKIAELPGVLHSEIRRIAMLPSNFAASVSVTIPRADAVSANRVIASRSAVAELAEARNQDAVELAMAVPQSMLKPEAADLPVTRVSLPNPGTYETASLSAPTIKLPMLPDDSAALPQQSMIPLIPLNLVPMPREAPGLPPATPAQLLHLEGKERAKAERCLANAIYFESRSEPLRGQMAVAQVVMNRVFSGFYPNDVCSVVYQNAHRHLACQFTFACDGKSKAITERGAWARANRIARQTLDGQIYLPEVGKSTHYHAVYVHPNWVHEMKKLVRYGIHNFYRPWAWGNGAEMPVWGGAGRKKEAAAR
jgi:hypothetical protein